MNGGGVTMTCVLRNIMHDVPSTYFPSEYLRIVDFVLFHFVDDEGGGNFWFAPSDLPRVYAACRAVSARSQLYNSYTYLHTNYNSK